MSETKNEAKTQALDPEELVEYTAPLDPTGEKADILVGVNGEFIRIQRGATVQIKRKFLEAIQNANEQLYAAMKAQQAAQKQAEKPALEM